MGVYLTLKMAASNSQVKVRQALESTESLLTSLVDRNTFLYPSHTESQPDHTDGTDGPYPPRGGSIDVEQSLIGTGEALSTVLSSPDTPTHTTSDATADILSSLGKLYNGNY